MTRFLIDDNAGQAQVDPGVEANSRLTASTGMVLTGLLLIEGFTLLDVRGYLTLHTIIGLALIGPIALKTAATIYRFARYYGGRAAYVRRGPPALVLRVIGPFVVISSIVVLGTGVALLVDHGRSDTWLTLHQASFIVWVSLTGVHFLAHIYEAVRATGRDLRGGRGDPAARGRSMRMLAVVASLAIGLGVAAAFTPDASYWHLDQHAYRGHFPGRPH